jgi:hypothetical protein
MEASKWKKVVINSKFHKNIIYMNDSLSHGYQTDTKKVSAVSAYFETMPYRLDEVN